MCVCVFMCMCSQCAHSHFTRVSLTAGGFSVSTVDGWVWSTPSWCCCCCSVGGGGGGCGRCGCC